MWEGRIRSLWVQTAGETTTSAPLPAVAPLVIRLVRLCRAFGPPAADGANRVCVGEQMERDETLNVRLSPSELDRIEEHAKRSGAAVSALIREDLQPS